MKSIPLVGERRQRREFRPGRMGSPEKRPLAHADHGRRQQQPHRLHGPGLRHRRREPGEDAEPALLRSQDRRPALDPQRGGPRPRAHPAGQPALRVDALRRRGASRGLAFVGRASLLRLRRQAPLDPRPGEICPYVGLRIVAGDPRRPRPAQLRAGRAHVPRLPRQEDRRRRVESGGAGRQGLRVGRLLGQPGSRPSTARSRSWWRFRIT